MTREVEARLKISAVDKTGRVMQQLAGRMQQVNRQAASLNRQQGMLGKTTASTMAVMSRYLAPAAVAAFSAGALKNFAAVERQMTRIGITADASAAETEDAFRRMQTVSKEMALPVDAAVTAVDTLVSSGLSLKDAMDFLPSVLATAQASGSATEDIANTAIKAASALKIEASQMQRAFDIMVMGGKAGQFELKDMATYIPELANSFASLGYSGEEGLKQLIAMLQTIREDTGSASAAATQAQNIFGKMFNDDTAKKFAKFGIDLRKELKAAQEQGEGALQAFVRLSQEAIKGDLSKLPQLFTDQEFRLGMQSLITSTDSWRGFLESVNSAEVDGTVFRDLERVTKDAQASIDRLSGSWDALVKRFGEKVATVATPAIDAVVSATDKQDAIDNALKKRGMGYLKSQIYQVGLSQKDQDLLAIEGGFKDPGLREKYQFGPGLPEGWKPENEFPGGGTSGGKMPEVGPIPRFRPTDLNAVPGRDRITAAMLARRGEIEFANNSASVVGLRPEQRNADLQHLLANLDRVEKGGSGRPWMDDGEKVGTEVGAAAIERMSSDARAVGSEVGSVVQEAMRAIAPQIGAAIAQAFAAGASQVKVGVNVGGGVRINADLGRSMPASLGLPPSTSR
ncbi:phage tail tape measure protein [Shinella zoogloeoides]|uniref:phage tail tape measure protein n=1 Tax=Shinella zoogloeoides TaxID=352475 RepID=UPI001F5A5B7A|nr:phage tail tape measure protein [Shinella zoogloeoides]